MDDVAGAPWQALEHGAMHGRHILYAEDSILSQRIVKRMLDRVGVQCTVVDNGQAAVEAVLHASPPFDCILMVRRCKLGAPH